MRRISIVGVIAGGGVSFFLPPMICGILSAFAFVVGLFVGGLGDAFLYLLAFIFAPLGFSTPYIILSALVSVLGGYLAARIANGAELLNGTLSSFLYVAEGVEMLLHSRLDHRIAGMIFCLILAPLAGLAGGHLRQLRKRTVARGPAT